VQPQLGIPRVVIILDQIGRNLNLITPGQFRFTLLMPFGGSFRTLVLEFLQLGIVMSSELAIARRWSTASRSGANICPDNSELLSSTK
jgi:hypothetical protein